MPKKPVVKNYEERVAEAWLEEAQKVAARIAAEEGDPPGADAVGEAEAVRLFGLKDRGAPYDLVYGMLTTTGVPPEQVGAMAVVQEAPELAELYAQPAPDEATAAMLATLAEYPFRWGLVIDYSDDPEEQVRWADALYKGWIETDPLASVSEDPEPAPPPAMMPEQPAPEMPQMQGGGAQPSPPAEPMMPMGG